MATNEIPPRATSLQFSGKLTSISDSLETEVLIVLRLHSLPDMSSHPLPERFCLPFADLATAGAFFRNLAQEIEESG